jgi:glycosyltransferase involved in cell wall biosynthesis
MPSPEFGIVIPACDEEECIGQVLEELLRTIDSQRFVIAVGVNGSSDRTAEIARKFPVLVAETDSAGYGFGCQAAIDLLKKTVPGVRAYIFFAGDGASDPDDIGTLVEAAEQGYQLVLGARTSKIDNWPVMTLSHVVANFALGIWCGLLTGRWFIDLGPLRLIERSLFDALAPSEMTFGWTIETQIGAATLRARVREVCVSERKRLAGEQKVSGVNWQRTFLIGCRIVAAGYRTRLRFAKMALPDAVRRGFLPQPQREA